jgi:hypothetical protein
MMKKQLLNNINFFRPLVIAMAEWSTLKCSGFLITQNKENSSRLKSLRNKKNPSCLQTKEINSSFKRYKQT